MDSKTKVINIKEFKEKYHLHLKWWEDKASPKGNQQCPRKEMWIPGRLCQGWLPQKNHSRAHELLPSPMHTPIVHHPFSPDAESMLKIQTRLLLRPGQLTEASFFGKKGEPPLEGKSVCQSLTNSSGTQIPGEGQTSFSLQQASLQTSGCQAKRHQRV